MALLMSLQVTFSAKAFPACRASVPAGTMRPCHVGLQLLRSVKTLLTFSTSMRLALRMLFFLMRSKLHQAGESEVTFSARDLQSWLRNRFLVIIFCFIIFCLGHLGRFGWASSFLLSSHQLWLVLQKCLLNDWFPQAPLPLPPFASLSFHQLLRPQF